MKTQKLLSATGLYIIFLFIGHHGPFADHAHKRDDQPHTHHKHVVKLLKHDEDSDRPMKARKYVPLTT
jgi:hypothetical protein